MSLLSKICSTVSERFDRDKGKLWSLWLRSCTSLLAQIQILQLSQKQKSSILTGRSTGILTKMLVFMLIDPIFSNFWCPWGLFSPMVSQQQKSLEYNLYSFFCLYTIHTPKFLYSALYSINKKIIIFNDFCIPAIYWYAFIPFYILQEVFSFTNTDHIPLHLTYTNCILFF